MALAIGQLAVASEPTPGGSFWCLGGEQEMVIRVVAHREAVARLGGTELRVRQGHPAARRPN